MFLKIWQEAVILTQWLSNRNSKFWLTGIFAPGADLQRVMAKRLSVAKRLLASRRPPICFCYHGAAFAGSRWIALI